jgi:hypothetical protein
VARVERLRVKNLLGGRRLLGDIEARISQKYLDSENLGVSLFRYGRKTEDGDGVYELDRSSAQWPPLPVTGPLALAVTIIGI